MPPSGLIDFLRGALLEFSDDFLILSYMIRARWKKEDVTLLRNPVYIERLGLSKISFVYYAPMDIRERERDIWSLSTSSQL